MELQEKFKRIQEKIFYIKERRNIPKKIFVDKATYKEMVALNNLVTVQIEGEKTLFGVRIYEVLTDELILEVI